MRHNKRRGARTVFFDTPPAVLSAASIVGDMEAAGAFQTEFDLALTDDTWGEDTWEKAECVMFERAVRLALGKAKMESDELHCLLGGDLLNQIISANYAARQLQVPFFGLYSACSTVAQALLMGSMMIDGGFVENAACAAASHFSTAERQYRYPLEMGTTTPPTAQRTVTGAGVILLGAEDAAPIGGFKGVRVMGGTFGKVIDLGVKDMANMGAAMAPAAADGILAHLADTGRDSAYYDLVVTGDLGVFGSEMLLELLSREGVELGARHMDCGASIFTKEQKLDCGGSGAGCAAVTLAAHLLPKLQSGECSRILFLATGALMSPAASMQGESIPGIAHAVVLERGT